MSGIVCARQKGASVTPEQPPRPEALARLDELTSEGWRLVVRDERERPWPHQGWRVELHWQNGNVCGCTMPTYAQAIELLASAYGAKW